MSMRERRAELVDSEKITINLGYVDLGRVDLLVRDGFYSNRTDFIRTAIRNQLAHQSDDLRNGLARRRLDLGLVHYGRPELEQARADNRMIDVNVVGLATIADDVSPDLALATIASVTVLGLLQASQAVRAALSGRIH